MSVLNNSMSIFVAEYIELFISAYSVELFTFSLKCTLSYLILPPFFGSRSDLISSDQCPFVSQQNQSSPLFQNESPLVPKSTRSPPLAFHNNLHTEANIPPLGGAQRSVWLQLLLSLLAFLKLKYCLNFVAYAYRTQVIA